MLVTSPILLVHTMLFLPQPLKRHWLYQWRQKLAGSQQPQPAQLPQPHQQLHAATAMACFFFSSSLSTTSACISSFAVTIVSVEFKSLGAAGAGAGAVADYLRKLHLLFSLGVVGRIKFGVVGFPLATEEKS
ncbi:hypothetical protein Q3G72_018638 [Acer saccharum]|nr:hypothetical protein Q3G72_018638 [Acer saccharum]